MKLKFLEYPIRESSSFKSKIYQNRNTHLCPNFYFDQFINGYFIPEKPIFGNFKVPLFAKLKKSTELRINEIKQLFINITQPAITCSKLTIETLEQGVKYVQS